MIDIFDESVKAVLTGYAAEVAKYTFGLFNKPTPGTLSKNQTTTENNYTDFINRALNQFTSVYNWARKTYTFDFLNPLDTSKHTIELGISYKLKKQRDGLNEYEILNESDLLASSGNIVILGDPGSGKTTTVKRLLLSSFFNTEPKYNQEFLYPILLLCRTFSGEKSFDIIIAEHLGLAYEVRQDKVVKFNVTTEQETIEYITNYYFGKLLLHDFIKDVVERFHFVIFIEGLDEIEYSNVNPLLKEIEAFAGSLLSAKIIMTCRAAFLPRRLQHFSYAQICELTPSQIRQISELFITNSDAFISDLYGKSYADIASRPLFLIYLILLFKNNPNNRQALPETSKEVYEEIVDFFLRKWDKERGVNRKSNYSLSKTTKKREFLSHLSFLLTYKIKSKIFSKDDLIFAYNLIAESFGLPLDEAEEVAEEIETHTGLIIKSYGVNYEFSHLSIQEYLCANYIVREPFSEEIKSYFREYPPPLALTISLSSNPSSWFVNIISKSLLELAESTAYFTTSAKIIFHRLKLENPYFTKSKELGYSILYLCDLCDCTNRDFQESLNSFVQGSVNVKSGLKESLDDFKLVSNRTPLLSKVRFKRKPLPLNETNSVISISEYGSLPLSTYTLLMDSTV